MFAFRFVAIGSFLCKGTPLGLPKRKVYCCTWHYAQCSYTTCTGNQMLLPTMSMGLCSSCLARQSNTRQAKVMPGKTSRRVASASQDEKGVPWFWKIMYNANNKLLYFAFVDLQEAFDRVPRKVLWWALRSLRVKEWAVSVIQGMYSNAQSRVQISGQYSEESGVGVGVHQGSVLSPLLFILVLEALSRQSHTGVPWQLLYVDDQGAVSKTLMSS